MFTLTPHLNSKYLLNCLIVFITILTLSSANRVKAQEPITGVKDNNQVQAINKKTFQKPSLQALVEPSPSVPETLPKSQKIQTEPSKVEQLVWPFTRWVEEKVQSSPLIRSPKETKTKPLQLRGAIQQAVNRYPGTVLSAERQTADSADKFRIKIISKQGIVKTIWVNEMPPKGEE